MSSYMVHQPCRRHEGLTAKKRKLYTKRLKLIALVKETPVRSFPKNCEAYRYYAANSDNLLSVRWIEQQFYEQTWDDIPEQYIGELNG